MKVDAQSKKIFNEHPQVIAKNSLFISVLTQVYNKAIQEGWDDLDFRTTWHFWKDQPYQSVTVKSMVDFYEGIQENKKSGYYKQKRIEDLRYWLFEHYDFLANIVDNHDGSFQPYWKEQSEEMITAMAWCFVGEQDRSMGAIHKAMGNPSIFNSYRNQVVERFDYFLNKYRKDFLNKLTEYNNTKGE